MMVVPKRESEPACHSTVATGFAVAGIAPLVAGESLCFLGPESHAHVRDIICHAIFYSGTACFAAGAILWRTHKR